MARERRPTRRRPTRRRAPRPAVAGERGLVNLGIPAGRPAWAGIAETGHSRGSTSASRAAMNSMYGMRSTERRRNHLVPLVAIHSTSSPRVGAGPVGSLARPLGHRDAGRLQPVPEPAGDQPVTALVGVQPVHRPVAPVIGLRVGRGVPVHRPVVRRDPVELGVDRPHPPRQRPREPGRQAEHLRRVRQPHGQHGRAARGERGDRPRGGLAGPHRVEPGPQRVVDADDDAGDVRPQQQRVRELVPLDVLGLRADRREVVQLRLGQPGGEMAGPAAPAAAGCRVAHAEGDRVAERHDSRHALPARGDECFRLCRQPGGRRVRVDDGRVVAE